jgi:hypothetical protein
MTPPPKGMGGHHSPSSETVVWLTPPEILAALGGPSWFDLDPCAVCEPRPWPTALQHYTKAHDGLSLPWRGRVWLNPPYGGPAVVNPWLERMADHGQGTALIFARTETAAFHAYVWRRATALLFLEGRLFFHRPDGQRADNNGGAPSVLVAYGETDAVVLEHCGLAGAFVRLTPPS